MRFLPQLHACDTWRYTPALVGVSRELLPRFSQPLQQRAGAAHLHAAAMKLLYSQRAAGPAFTRLPYDPARLLLAGQPPKVAPPHACELAPTAGVTIGVRMRVSVCYSPFQPPRKQMKPC